MDTRGISTKAQNATTAERQTPSINERREGDVESETSLGRPRVRGPRSATESRLAYEPKPGIAIPCSDSRTTPTADGAVVRRFSDTRRSSVGPTGRVAATDAWLGDRQSLSDGRAAVLPTPAPTAPAATVKTAHSVPPGHPTSRRVHPRGSFPRPLGESTPRGSLSLLPVQHNGPDAVAPGPLSLLPVVTSRCRWPTPSSAPQRARPPLRGGSVWRTPETQRVRPRRARTRRA